jgi:hypothetical protein
LTVYVHRQEICPCFILSLNNTYIDTLASSKWRTVNMVFNFSSSETITPIGLSSAIQRHHVVTTHVQIELQEKGAVWFLKGCTAYVSDGTKRPIRFVEHAFRSRGQAIKAMKRQARQEVSLGDFQTIVRIRWKLVLWPPYWTILSPA